MFICLVPDERISKEQDILYCYCVCVAFTMMSRLFHPALLWRSAKNAAYIELSHIVQVMNVLAH